MYIPNMQSRQLSISLPAKYWEELEDYAAVNKLTIEGAASDTLLCAIGEWLATADYIDYLSKEQEERNESA
jgi:hypothetical protein